MGQGRFSRGGIGAWLAEFGLALPLALLSFLGPLTGLALLSSTAGLWFEPLRDQGAWTPLWIFGGTVLLAGLSLMPTHASSLVAGMLLGFGPGSLLALLGTLGAAALGYQVLTRLVGGRVLLALERRPRASLVHRAVLGRTGLGLAAVVALVRLSPLMPFAATNLVMAASRVAFWPFLLGTALGIAPRVAVVALAGSGLDRLDLDSPADRRLAVLGLVATAGVVWVITRWARRALAAAERGWN